MSRRLYKGRKARGGGGGGSGSVVPIKLENPLPATEQARIMQEDLSEQTSAALRSVRIMEKHRAKMIKKGKSARRERGGHFTVRLQDQLRRTDCRMKTLLEECKKSVRLCQQLSAQLAELEVRYQRDLNHVLGWCRKEWTSPGRHELVTTPSVTLSANVAPRT